MSFRNLEIHSSYEVNNKIDPVENFYIPCLNEATEYDRLAGFFSSSGLMIAARGIAGLIKNNGKMRLVISPILSEEDSLLINEYVTNPDKYLNKILLDEIENISNEIEKNHVEALGWMLANKFLEIKLAIVKNKEEHDALFHQKVGIMKDKTGDYISFSGSINETISGWVFNSEEFKVFKSWEDGQSEYFVSDKIKFNDIWAGTRGNIKIVDLPQAVKAKMISIGKDFSNEKFLAMKYKKNKDNNKETVKEFPEISLFSYQQRALEKWIEHDNKLLFEMATGTGKTRTAIACLLHLLKTKKNLLTIITTPQNTLSKQWKGEIKKLGISLDYTIIADSTNPKWKSDLETQIGRLNIDLIDNLTVFTTHSTFSSIDFIERMYLYRKSNNICIIGDEAHGLGSSETRKGLLPEYKYRIGLSATPQRWFDDFGTSIIESYFGNASFEFSIHDALININPITNKPFLVPYKYVPKFIQLTEEEMDKYRALSNKIKRMASMGQDDPEYQKLFENLLFLRANIQKNAQNKIELFKRMVTEIDLCDTIIFVSPEQKDIVMQTLGENNIIATRYTMEQGTAPEKKYNGLSEREYIIKKFKEGLYKVLVAIKCLDEGIDIPSASTAILLASSTNPREYVQRIGRVIRQAKNKTSAIIYDYVIEPNLSILGDPELRKFEKEIFEKELNRVEDMAQNAKNNAEVLVEINKKRGQLIYE